MDEDNLRDLGAHLDASLGGAVTSQAIAFGELTLVVEAQRLLEVMTFLRDDPTCRFSVLIDLCGVDYPERARRFDVVYHLLSMHQNQRIRVKIETADGAAVPTLVGLYPAANWFEREAFDMYGIVFADHPDLRRILTDYGFDGHPFRKDFPLTGYVEVRYDDAEKRVVYEPVKLTQDFRRFDFLSPWEGAKYVLPGDEKATAAPDGGKK